ncbi:enoyl-CoA hydratase/isomerase family protein [Acidianus sulfidivorans JP7]|uniref:Enoyl-CoA hydratase/isomerase family protein n=1 Tax=Acidianus sulfidivorans JP7 TaxID=619593 RepID=A0A2U9IKF3_9CREN|nr:enoyl-CoA hydratase/isomerase family protein [Acidianus sulfidivorans]AWR96465.1 enoyl-CoA hydratase/isomerase family protein [Acidianus sulfidivorans JP7]
MYIRVEFSRKDIAKMIINTNTKYNVMNIKFMTEFLDTLTEIEKEKKYKFLIIKGENNFGSGADIKELNIASKDREYAISFFNYMKEIYNRLINLDKITIAQVEGVAYGAHLEMLLVMDFVISKNDAKFAAPGGKIGVFPPVLTVLGPYVIGIQNTRRLAMLGEEITAEEAEKIGLITKSTDNIELETEKIIAKMHNMAPSSLILMKRHIAKYLSRDLDSVFKTLSIQVTSDDARDGINAFLSKLKPSWLLDLPQSQ